MQSSVSQSVEHVPLVAQEIILGGTVRSIYIILLLIFILMTIGKMWLAPQMYNFMDYYCLA